MRWGGDAGVEQDVMTGFKEWLVEYAYLLIGITIVSCLFWLAEILIGGWAHYLGYIWGIPLGVAFALGKIYARRHD